MRRRVVLIAAGGWLANAFPLAGRAQTKDQPIVIGWIEAGSPETSASALGWFREGLSALGLKEGAQIVLEQGWLHGRSDRIETVARKLAENKPAVIVTSPRTITVAVAKSLPKIPLVQAWGGNLVSVGLAASLARPGGMVTGLVNLSVDIVEKRTELLHDIVPNVERIGYLRDPNATSNPASIESVKRASSRLKLQALFAEAAHAEDLADAFSRLKNSGAQALVLLPSGWFTAERDRIAKLALEYRWPLIGGGTMADAGGLASYSADRAYNYRRAAWYVDQILKGRKPGDLPIEQPSKFELAANLKTAKALGITIPPVVMVRVDRVIK